MKLYYGLRKTCFSFFLVIPVGLIGANTSHGGHGGETLSAYIACRKPKNG